MTQNYISSTSKKYSKALFDIASENNSLELFADQLGEICEVLSSSQDLCVVMNNSSISQTKKNEILEAVFSDKIDSKLLNFLRILVSKNRFSELENIYNSYLERIKQNFNRKDVEIVSSLDLDEQMKSEIVEKLRQKLHSEVLPQWKTDADIIGGLIFKFDDFIVDMSIRAKLKDLSKNILR